MRCVKRLDGVVEYDKIGCDLTVYIVVLRTTPAVRSLGTRSMSACRESSLALRRSSESSPRL